MPTSSTFRFQQQSHEELIAGGQRLHEKTFERLREMGLHHGPTPPRVIVTQLTQATGQVKVTSATDEAKKLARRARRAARKERQRATCGTCGVASGHMRGCPDA